MGVLLPVTTARTCCAHSLDNMLLAMFAKMMSLCARGGRGGENQPFASILRKRYSGIVRAEMYQGFDRFSCSKSKTDE